MAVSAYTGPPGSGKSFALVAEIIIGGVRRGRRVLTNVAGVKPAEVVAFCEGKRSAKDGSVGSVVLFAGEDTLAPGFFPDLDDPAAPSVVQPGDLVVMDEVRIFWPARGKFPPQIMKFLRMHRHFVSAVTGQSTDIVLASQMVTDFHLDYRGLFERSFKFKKLATLGAPNRYVWSSWEGSAQRKGEAVLSGGGKYRPEIFNLYSSYSKADGAAGVETSTDNRGNFFASPKFIGSAIFVVVVLVFGAIKLYGLFFAAKPHPSTARSSIAAVSPASSDLADTSATAAPIPSTAAAVRPVSKWRIAGTMSGAGSDAVVLVDGEGNVRYESPGAFNFVAGRPVFGLVDGQRAVTTGTSPAGGSSLFGGPK